DAEWSRYFEVNLMSAVRLSRRLLPGMLEKGWGRVVFIGTESAVDVPGDMVHYGATKAAALALSNGLAKLTRGTEVTVITVLGRPTYSDGVAASIERTAAAQSMPAADLRDSLVRDTSLRQRFIAPSEIANLVAYLASPLSSATNGAACVPTAECCRPCEVSNPAVRDGQATGGSVISRRPARQHSCGFGEHSLGHRLDERRP